MSEFNTTITPISQGTTTQEKETVKKFIPNSEAQQATINSANSVKMKELLTLSETERYLRTQVFVFDDTLIDSIKATYNQSCPFDSNGKLSAAFMLGYKQALLDTKKLSANGSLELLEQLVALNSKLNKGGVI